MYDAGFDKLALTYVLPDVVANEGFNLVSEGIGESPGIGVPLLAVLWPPSIDLAGETSYSDMFFETATLPEKNLVYVPDTSPVFAYLSRYSSIEVKAISAYCA